MTPLFYREQEKFYVSVDCIILGFKDGKLYLLISKRKFEPQEGQDTLMGGFLRSSGKPENKLYTNYWRQGLVQCGDK